MLNYLQFDSLLTGPYLDRVVSGLITTIMLAIVSWIFAMILGIVLTLVRLVPAKICNWFAITYVAYHQNVPLLVQILFWYFVAPTIFPQSWQDFINNNNSEFILATIALTLCYTAQISEALRSGIRAIPKAQYECGRVLSFNHVETLAYIIMPQAARNSIPLLTNISLGLFKGTSIAMAVGVHELTYQVMQIENLTFRTFEAFSIVTIIYLILSLFIVLGGRSVERACSVSK
jgi:polar amino acid transport system permease protein